MFVFDSLDPSVIGGQATSADVNRAKQRLALQATIDPALSNLRYLASQNLLDQTARIGQGPQEDVAAAMVQEALAGGAQTNSLRDRLLSAAQTELDLGATLSPDVQAELVQAGLERSGMVTGAASPKGLGGTLLRQMLGQGALKLQADRQARAAALAQTASSLESQRQQILGSIYPNLNTGQLNNLSATNAALSSANQLVPEAGLGGSDIANIWLARVGAVNQLQQSAADVAARGALAQSQAWQQGIGAASGFLANQGNQGSTYNTVRGWFSQPQQTQAPASSGGGSGYSPEQAYALSALLG